MTAAAAATGMKLLIQCAAVGAAGFVGALARFGLSRAVHAWNPAAVPLATLAINVTGSFFLGWFLTVVPARYPASDTFRLAVATGFVGAYTTFSTFAYETDAMLRDGKLATAGLYVGGSVILGLVACAAGVAAGR